MIDINLVPGARRSKAAARRSINFGQLITGLSRRIKDKFLIGTVAAIVVAVGVVAGLYLTQLHSAEVLSDRHDQAVKDSTHYANFLRDRYKAEAVRDTLLREVNIIRSLDEDRYVWPHVMDEVSRALPQYTWVTMMAFAGVPQGQNNVVAAPKADTAKKTAHRPKRLETDVPKDQIQIRLTGRTVDIEALTRFMKDLEASPFLGNVVLEKSEPATDQGKEVTQFQLTLNYTRPDSTYIHRVPLTLASVPGAR